MRTVRWSVFFAIILVIALAANTGLAQGPDDPSVEELDTTSTAAIITGTLPWTSGVIDSISGSYTGQFVSMAMQQNLRMPYISYYDAKNKDLRLARPR